MSSFTLLVFPLFVVPTIGIGLALVFVVLRRTSEPDPVANQTARLRRPQPQQQRDYS